MMISTILTWIGYFFLFIGVPGGAIRALADREQRAQGLRLSARSLVAFVVCLAAAYLAAGQGL